MKGSGHCVHQAWFNQEHAYKEKGLRVVFGSLGLGSGNDPHFEYGGRNHRTWSDFQSFKPGMSALLSPADRAALARKVDIHAWLEDAMGNVYDVCFPEWTLFAAVHRRAMPEKVRGGCVLNGVSKDVARTEYGLHYVPAPPETHEVIEKCIKKLHHELYLQYLEKYYRPMYDKVLMGSSK